MKRAITVFLIVAATASVVFACGFQSSRVSWQRFYRMQGFELPGIATGELVPAANVTPVPGLVAKAVRLKEGEIIGFPATDFKLDGKRREMPEQLMKASVVRWELEGSGRVVAYTYTLAPVEVYRDNSGTTATAIAKCDFQATFIDDKGDGKFRLMHTEPMRAGLIPDWAKRPKS